MTASGWEAYYLFFLAGGAALALPITLSASSALLRRVSLGHQHPEGSHDSARLPETKQNSSRIGESHQKRLLGQGPWLNKRTNTRYFHAASVALALCVLTLIIAPFAAGLKTKAGTAGVGPLLLGLLLLSGYAFLAVLYVSRKRDAQWVPHYQAGDVPSNQTENQSVTDSLTEESPEQKSEAKES